MKKISIAIPVLLLSGFFSGFAPAPHNSVLSSELKAAWIPLSPDSSFAGMQWIEPYCESKRIIMLSDGHQDGYSKGPILKLVRFLHERCGYDVLALESDLYDGEFMQHEIARSPDSLYFFSQHYIRNFISHCSQSKPLFDYAASTEPASQPLLITGFDCDFVRDEHASHFLTSQLDSVLLNRDAIFASGKEYKKFSALFDSLLHNNNYFNKVDTVDVPFVNSFADSVCRKLQEVKDVNGWWALTGRNVKRVISCYAMKGKHPEIVALNREEGLWDNLQWLLTKRYPGKKIIVWASGLHLSDNEKIRKDTKQNYPVNTCGHYLRNSIWKDSVAFFPTQIISPETKPAGKLEEALNEASLSDGLIVFWHLRPKGWHKMQHVEFKSSSMEYYYTDLFEGFLISNKNENCDWIE